MYLFINISMLCLTIFTAVMIVFNGMTYYGGCGWGDKGGCVKCTRSSGRCLFTDWPMCTTILACILAIVLLAYICPPTPTEDVAKNFARAELQEFYANNGMSKNGLKIREKK